MTHLDKLQQIYMLAALNTKEAHSNKNVKDIMTYLNSKLATKS